MMPARRQQLYSFASCGHAMRDRAGLSAVMLPMLAKIATHTLCSEEWQALQQFPTPLPLGSTAWLRRITSALALFCEAGASLPPPAHDMDVAEATVKAHQGRAIQKMQANSLPEVDWMDDKLKLVHDNAATLLELSAF